MYISQQKLPATMPLSHHQLLISIKVTFVCATFHYIYLTSHLHISNLYSIHPLLYYTSHPYHLKTMTTFSELDFRTVSSPNPHNPSNHPPNTLHQRLTTCFRQIQRGNLTEAEITSQEQATSRFVRRLADQIISLCTLALTACRPVAYGLRYLTRRLQRWFEKLVIRRVALTLERLVVQWAGLLRGAEVLASYGPRYVNAGIEECLNLQSWFLLR